MIDRESRTRLGEMIRHFVSGQITNSEFDDAYESSQDYIICAVFWSVWLLYDDLRTYRLVGKHRLDKETRRILARCVLFLQSDLPYVDRKVSAKARWLWLLSGMTFGLVEKPEEFKQDEWHTQNVWPFAAKEDLDDARRHPKLLCGRV